MRFKIPPEPNHMVVLLLIISELSGLPDSLRKGNPLAQVGLLQSPGGFRSGFGTQREGKAKPSQNHIPNLPRFGFVLFFNEFPGNPLEERVGEELKGRGMGELPGPFTAISVHSVLLNGNCTMENSSGRLLGWNGKPT